MDTDKRFKHLANDPRFKPLRKKQKKVETDERFMSMFNDEKFTLKYTRDKRGWHEKKTTAHEDEDEDEDDNDNDNDNEDEDEDDDEESDLESDVSTSSDEPESDEDRLNSGVDIDRVRFDWQPLDHDAEKTDSISRRLAIQNLDWDQLDVKDIFVLFNSIRPPLSVKIFVSEFGKKRLAREEQEGPEELADQKIDEDEEELKKLEEKMQLLENQDKIVGRKFKINEYEDADEMIDAKDEELRERIRRYQLSKMKYYYAIAEFDSPESAEAVYKELDGLEYEASSLELDLRFVPDDIVFDPEDLRAECNKAPDLATYKAPHFVSSALQQTTVKFTWDETDVKRQEKLRRAYTKEELEKDDLEAYLASETDSDEEEDCEDLKNDGLSVVTCNSEARAHKYKLLLKNLEEEEVSKKKIDVDVVWGNYEKDEAVMAEVGRQDDDDGSDDNDSDDDDEDLDLLLLDVNARPTDFKFNPDDERFKAIYDSGLFNIDPSHPNFKPSETFHLIAEKKRSNRQKQPARK